MSRTHAHRLASRIGAALTTVLILGPSLGAAANSDILEPAANTWFADVRVDRQLGGSVAWSGLEGITKRCDLGRGNTRSCSEDAVDRGEMSGEWLAQLAALPASAAGPELTIVDDSHLLEAAPDTTSDTLGLAAGRDTVVCFGDGQDGPRIQVLHIVADNKKVPVPAAEIRRNVAKVATVFEESARRHGGPVVTPRFVHDDKCRPTITQVAVPASAYKAGYQPVFDWLHDNGYARDDRKYLLMVHDRTKNICGRGTYFFDASPGLDNANNRRTGYAYVERSCWGHIETHEVVHTLGAVLEGAPNANSAGHCSDEHDIMCYDDGTGTRLRKVCSEAWEQLLDCGGDDYFNPNPKPGSYLATHWNIFNSSFLGFVRNGKGVNSTGTFRDVDDRDLFTADIERLAASGITKGCNPPINNRFCPDGSVTRGQMAAFLVRALGLPAGKSTFSDTQGHVFATDVAALADAGITRGCGPNTFCPDEPVTRGQMAAFLVRALGLPAGKASFADTKGHVFADDVAALADAGITRGCGPNRFCPDEPVTRGQMAAFLVRAGLAD